MTPVGINGISAQGKGVNGVQTKQALSSGSETVTKGAYNATTLSAVDADLAAANIKSGATIFGVAGTVIQSGTETISKYADATLASGASYTPAASGTFFNGAPVFAFQPYYYSTLAASWWGIAGGAYTFAGFTAIGDGANFRITNNNVASKEYCLMRHYYSTGTYERARDAQLATGTSYTPATAGFFANAAELTACQFQLLYTSASWSWTRDYVSTNQPITIVIGDGTNLRIINNNALASYYVIMRVKLT